MSEEQPKTRQQSEMEQLSRAEWYQRKMFGENFVGAVLADINFLGDAPRRILEWIQEPKKFIVMYGEAGTGKTHFCAAILVELLRRYGHVRALNENTLMSKTRNFISKGTGGDYIEYMTAFCDERIMIFDDIGSSGYTTWREEILMELIDFRYRNSLPTIFTSNMNEYGFAKLYGKRITSRLFATENVIIDTHGMPDYRNEGK